MCHKDRTFIDIFQVFYSKVPNNLEKIHYIITHYSQEFRTFATEKEKSVDRDDQFVLVGVDPVLRHGARNAVDRLEVVRQERAA